MSKSFKYGNKTRNSAFGNKNSNGFVKRNTNSWNTWNNPSVPYIFFGNAPNHFTVIEHEEVVPLEQQYLHDDINTDTKIVTTINNINEALKIIIEEMFNITVTDAEIDALYDNESIDDNDFKALITIDLYKVYRAYQLEKDFNDVGALIKHDMHLDNNQYRGFSNIYINDDYMQLVRNKIKSLPNNGTRYTINVTSSLPTTYFDIKSWITINNDLKIITTEVGKNFGISRKYFTKDYLSERDTVIKELTSMIEYFDKIYFDCCRQKNDKAKVTIEEAFIKLFNYNEPVVNLFKQSDEEDTDEEFELLNDMKHFLKYMIAIFKTTIKGTIHLINSKNGLSAYYNFMHGFRNVNNTAVIKTNVKAISIYTYFNETNFMQLWQKLIALSMDYPNFQTYGGNTLVETEYKEMNGKQFVNKILLNYMFNKEQYTIHIKIASGKENNFKVYTSMYKSNAFEGFITPYNMHLYNHNYIKRDLELTTASTNIVRDFNLFKQFIKMSPESKDLEELAVDSTKVLEYVNKMHSCINDSYNGALSFIKFIMNNLSKLNCKSLTIDAIFKAIFNASDIGDRMLDTMDIIIPNYFKDYQDAVIIKLTKALLAYIHDNSELLNTLDKTELVDIVKKSFVCSKANNLMFTANSTSLRKQFITFTQTGVVIKGFEDNEFITNVINSRKLPSNKHSFKKQLNKELSKIIKNNVYTGAEVAVYRVIINLMIFLQDDIDYLQYIEFINNAVSNALWCNSMACPLSSLMSNLIRDTFRTGYENSKLEKMLNMFGNNEDFQQLFENTYYDLLNTCMFDDFKDNANSIVNFIGLYNVIPFSVTECCDKIFNYLDKYLLSTLEKDKEIVNLMLNKLKIELTPMIYKNDMKLCTTLVNDICDKVRGYIQSQYTEFKQYINHETIIVEIKYIEFIDVLLDRIVSIINEFTNSNNEIYIADCYMRLTNKVFDLLE